MAKSVVFLFFLSINLCFSQSKECSCTVKLSKVQLGLMLSLSGHIQNSRDIPKEYTPLIPDDGKTYAFHKVIKDSANFWFIKSNFRDAAKKHIIVKTVKIPTTFLVTVLLQSMDSVPVYSQPDRNSKILRYIRPNDKLSAENNDYWFARCTKDFVKIILMDASMKGGWVSEDNIEK